MKKFTVTTKDGSKWLTLIPSKPIWGNEKEWMEEVLSEDLPYIGSHPEGTAVYESEVREVRQRKRTDRTNADWQDMFDGIVPLPIDYHETRTVYTDAESHDRHIRPFKTHNVRPLVNQLVGEEISFSKFIELLNEIANTH